VLYEERSTRAQAEGVRSVPGGAADESRASTAVQAAEVEGAAPLPVLLVTSNQVFADRLRQGLSGSSEVDLIVRNAPRAKTPLSRLVAGTGVRLVVLDSVLFEKGVVGLSFPADLSEDAPEMLLLFDKVGEPAVQLSLLSRAHGCLEFGISTQDFARAVESVAHGGELWFPRWMMEPFYDMALAAMAAAGTDKADPASALTEREVEVLRLVQRGLTNKHVAEKLGISPNTVKKHLHNALLKRGMHRRRQLFR
jgi:DNA-binding NarL/FixJ family response regulator